MPLIKNVYATITNSVLPNSGDISTKPVSYVNNVIQSIFSIFITVGVVYFIFRFIFGGYKIISSNGDPKKYEEAMASIRYSLTGIVIIFSVFVIVQLLGTVFGIEGLNKLSITWPTL